MGIFDRAPKQNDKQSMLVHAERIAHIAYPKTTETAPAPRIREGVLGTSPSLGSFLQMGTSGSATTATGALNLYNQSTAISVPINALAQAFSQLTPVLQLEDGTIENEHEVLRLLKRPSPFFDASLFMECLATNYLITGEAFVVASGNISRPPLQLNPVSPAKVSPDTVSSSMVHKWTVTDDIQQDIYTAVEENVLSIRYLDSLQLKELQQIRNFSTKDNSTIRGQSPLVSASKEVLQHILGGKHNVSLLEKGGRLSLVFHYATDFTQDDYDETDARVQATFGGASNAGGIATAAGPDLDIKEFGTNNKDMDFHDLQVMIRQVCAQVYHVPLPLVSLNAATYNAYPTALLALYDDAVGPLANRLFGGLGELLLPRYNIDPASVKITFDREKVPALRKRAGEELVLRREVNVESTDEIRAGLGIGDYEPNDQPGGTIMVQSTLVPLGDKPQDPAVTLNVNSPPEQGQPAAPVAPADPAES